MRKLKLDLSWLSYLMKHLPAITVDDRTTKIQQQVYNGDQRKYFEFPCILLANCVDLQNRQEIS